MKVMPAKLLLHGLVWVCLYICTIAMVTCFMMYNRRPSVVSIPPIHVPPPDKKEWVPSIFVSIASYRDSKCVETVQSAIKNARLPWRLHFGVCIQENSDIDDTFPSPCSWLHGHPMYDHVLIARIPHTDARGPTYARYVCNTLYRGQDLFLQIDSHMQFVSDWDTRLVNQYNACCQMSGHQRVIISHYPPACMTPEIEHGAITVTMMLGKLEEPGIPSLSSVQGKATSYPTPGWYLACGLMLAPGSFVDEVPYDPNLECLFWGEEILLSARAWTSGYNIYNPAFAVCAHQYNRVDRPNVVYDQIQAGTIGEWTRMQNESVHRAMRMLNIMFTGATPLDEPSEYSMGDSRTLEEYELSSGVGALIDSGMHDHANHSDAQSS